MRVFGGGALLVLAACGGATPRPDAGRPNVVFILLDNVGQEWFGCYGSEERCTPNIDRLARGGVRVEHCYAHPVCGPSRAQLLTGRYPFRTGWTVHHDAGLYGGGGLDPSREVLIPRLFREAGYATGIAGKWQVNNLYDEPGVLGRHGFDEHLVWPGSLDRDRVKGERLEAYHENVRRGRADELTVAIREIESRYWDPVLIRNGRRETHPGKFGPDLFQEFALDFVRRHQGRPFFLYYPTVLTHGQSFTEAAVPTPLNKGQALGEREMFGDMLRYADRLVGELIAALEAAGLRGRTVVFVASDNGTEHRFVARRNGREVRGGLYGLTEAGQVVLLVNSPGRVVPGTCELADMTDVFPTLCDLAGLTRPRGVTLDGRSLAPLLRGRETAGPRPWIFNQSHTRRVVREGRYKCYSTGELYDVREDPEESRDLSASPPPEAAAARARLNGVLASLPPDASLPFPPRSLQAFRLRAAGDLK